MYIRMYIRTYTYVYMYNMDIHTLIDTYISHMHTDATLWIS